MNNYLVFATAAVKSAQRKWNKNYNSFLCNEGTWYTFFGRCVSFTRARKSPSSARAHIKMATLYMYVEMLMTFVVLF